MLKRHPLAGNPRITYASVPSSLGLAASKQMIYVTNNNIEASLMLSPQREMKLSDVTL